MIKIKIDRTNDVDWIQKLKEDEVHMVVPACQGLTMCSSYMEFYCGLRFEEQVPHLQRIVRNKETGTFLPNKALTILPTLTIAEGWGGNHEFHKSFDDEIYNKMVIDVFEAHKMCPERQLVFDFRNDFDGIRHQFLRHLRVYCLSPSENHKIKELTFIPKY